jgi:hypothetical protein
MRRVVVFAVLMTLMFVACGEDGPTTLAEGDVEFVGSDGLGGQSLNITAEEQDGEVTGEIQFTDDDNEDSTALVTVQCADTDTDGVVILGGEITSSSDDQGVGELVALFIREGDPDSAALWLDEGENASCSDLLANRQDVLEDDSAFVDVESGDIETG